MVRRVLVAVLSERGHEVLEAEDGDSGLRAAKESQPDLILLDIGLPGVHGTRVLDLLKSDSRLEAIPVIMVSSYGEQPTVEIAKRHGAFDLVAKPFTPAELLERVEAALGG